MTTTKRRAPTLDPRAAVSEEQIVVRLPHDLLHLLDERVVEMREQHPAMRVTRSDAVRALLFAGLAGKGRR